MRVYQRAVSKVIAQKFPSSYKRSAHVVSRCCTSMHRGVGIDYDTAMQQRSNSSLSSRRNRMTSTLSTSILQSASSSRGSTNTYNTVKSTQQTSPIARYFSSAAAVDDDDDDTSPPPASYTIQRRQGIRNVAIVAHVDHGKTTLVDELLKVAMASVAVDESTATDGDAQSTTATSEESSGKNSEGERLMDSGDLEKERGITITSKVTRCDYASSSTSNLPTDENYVINIVDTPGHADFAGEVDRILSTVDGVVLVVDAGEGPKSQTKYVLSRALSLGLVPIVVLNKADRMESLGRLESGETELDLMDLFEALGATEEQMEYRTLFGSARSGWITDDSDVAVAIAKGEKDTKEAAGTMAGLLDAILEDIPAPSVHWYGDDADESTADGTPKKVEDFANEPFSMTANTVGYDSYLGRTCTGRIYSGQITTGDSITLLKRQDKDSDDTTTGGSASNSTGPKSEVAGVFANRGISRVPLEPAIAHAGDIVTLAGVPDSMKVGDTLSSTNNMVSAAIDTPPLTPPTLSCFFGANNGPLSGMEGQFVASSQVRARLINETDNNVTLTVEKNDNDAEKTVVFGRGELQIGILVEQMRREGFEMIITPPQILLTTCPETGDKLEPYEEVVVDVDAEYSGAVVNALTGARKGVLVEMMDDAKGKTRMQFQVPSRGLLGFGPMIATATRGTAVMHHCYLEDREYAGIIRTGSDKGKLVSNGQGKATADALDSLSARGTLFVEPGDMVYAGMVIGENAKTGDLEVNPVRAKKLDNMRTQSKEEKVSLPPPKRMSVEELIGYMNEDEVIEVTPLSVRLRKLELDSGVRERAARKRKKQMDALKSPTKGKK